MEQFKHLDVKTIEIAGITASIAGGYRPCLDYHFKKSHEVGCIIKQAKEAVESPRAHWLRRARKLGSPLLVAGLASIKNKIPIWGSKIPRSWLRGTSIRENDKTEINIRY